MLEGVAAILRELIPLVIATVVPVLAARLAAELLAFRARLPQQQRELLDQLVVVAVYAAEQLGRTGIVRDKKAYAIQVVERELRRYGFSVDVALIEARIEAAVFRFFSQWPKEPPTG